MSFLYGPPLLAGEFNVGPGSFGVLGSAVASDGIDGPSYVFSSLSLPTDASKEYFAWITTPPTAGVLTINPSNLSFTWAGLPQGTHSFGFTIVEDGVELSPESFVYAEVDVVRQLGGSVELADSVLSSGALFVADIAVYGAPRLDDAEASGEMECINPSTLDGSVALAAATVSGSMGIEIDETPLTLGEMRQLYNWMRDLHTIHGLAVGAPLVIGQSTRLAGHISQSVADVGGATVVTRG